MIVWITYVKISTIVVSARMSILSKEIEKFEVGIRNKTNGHLTRSFQNLETIPHVITHVVIRKQWFLIMEIQKIVTEQLFYSNAKFPYKVVSTSNCS